MEEFIKLCDELEKEFPLLFVHVSRTREGLWGARLLGAPGDGEKLALSGEGSSMEEACADCVADNAAQKVRSARIRELLQIPEVVEALRLGLKLSDPTGKEPA